MHHAHRQNLPTAPGALTATYVKGSSHVGPRGGPRQGDMAKAQKGPTKARAIPFLC